MANFQVFFSVQGTCGSPTGPDPENKVVDQVAGSPGRPVCSGWQMPGSQGIFVQDQEYLAEIPAAFFLQNVLQLHQQR